MQVTNGRWKPGHSGNAKGRTPGTGEVAKLRAAIGKCLPAIIKAQVAAALAGDTGAARLLLERVVPPLKAAELPAELAMPDGTLTEQGRALMAAAAAGQLAPGQAAQLLAGLGSLAKLTEVDDLVARIAALEAKHAVRD